MRQKVIILIALSLALALTFFAVGCAGERERSDYYPHHAELALTIPVEYAEFDSDSFDAAFTDGSAIVGITRMSFAVAVAGNIPETYTASEFARWWSLKNGRNVEIKLTGDTPYYEYTDDNGYYFLLSFYRSRYAYFTVLFTCASEKKEEYRPLFVNYAKDAYFTE